MNTLGKTTIALAAVAVMATGTQTFAQTDSKLSKIDRAELQQLRKSGDREAFKQKIQDLGIERKNKPQLTDDQKETLKKLKESGDREAIKTQLSEWGIEKPLQRMNGKGRKIGHALQDLTEEQKAELEALRESGDKEAVRAKLAEFGIEMPERGNRPEITEEQKAKIQELREAGDRDALKAYYEEIGLTKKVHKMQKRAEFFGSLSEDEKQALQEARDIARAGDRETAKEMIKEIFGSNENIEQPARGIRGFFKRMFSR